MAAADAALVLRAEGNALFAKREWRRAATVYTEAIGALTRQDDNVANSLAVYWGEGVLDSDSLLLLSILLSNRSSCRYEVGDYDDAASDAKACIEILDEQVSPECSKRDPLLCKNLWRLARALHYGEGERDEVCSFLRRLESSADKSFSSNASKMLGQLKYYEDSAHVTGAGQGQTKFQPALLRARLQDPYSQYFRFGHDKSESLLRHPDIDSQSIHLKDLNDDELSLALLFGGVGDARHVMATLLDAHHQYLTLPSRKKEKFRLHLTLNDINSQAIAKDLLMLVLSHELARSAKDSKSAFENNEPCCLAMVIMYGSMGVVMPSMVYAKLVDCLEKWFIGSSRDEFVKAFPWMTLSQSTWVRVVVTMSAWADPDGRYTPPLPSVGEALDNVQDNHSFDDSMSVMGSTFATSVAERRSGYRKQLEHMEIPPHMKEIIRQTSRDGISEREAFIELMINMAENDGFSDSNLYYSEMDLIVFNRTHALLPPRTLNTSNVPADKLDPLIRVLEHKIRKEWVVNPIEIDPDFNVFVNGNHSPSMNNPPKQFAKDFFPDAVKSYLSEQPIQVVDEDDVPDSGTIENKEGLARNVTLYYWLVGKAIIQLRNKVKMEMALGDIVGLGSQDRTEQNLPTKFQRMILSNIPDYVGMHSVFVALVPLLSANTKSITTSLRSNVLLNNSCWKSYDDYLFSTACLTRKDAKQVFGMEVIGSNPSVNDHYLTWRRVCTEAEPIQPAMLRIWLHRLYLISVLPSDRDPNVATRVEVANSCGLFIATLNFCIKELNVPAHQVFSILDDLLGKTSLATKAALSNDSPVPSMSLQDSGRSKKKAHNLSAFHLELLNQAAIFMQCNILRRCILSTELLPVGRCSLYKLKLSGLQTIGTADWEDTVGRRGSTAALGFLLQEQKTRYNIRTGAKELDNNPMGMMMAMMGGGDRDMLNMMKKQSKLRQDLLSQGSAVGHVFSCLSWNLKTLTVSFWMCDDLFEKFKGHHFSMIRTDGWFALPHRDIRLGEAKRN